MVRTPSERRAAMFARDGTSCGARWWWLPWRERNATGTGEALLSLSSVVVSAAIEVIFEDVGWCSSTEIGDEGAPHGVAMCSSATGMKFSSFCRPVPPITAMRIGPVVSC